MYVAWIAPILPKLFSRTNHGHNSIQKMLNHCYSGGQVDENKCFPSFFYFFVPLLFLLLPQPPVHESTADVHITYRPPLFFRSAESHFIVTCDHTSHCSPCWKRHLSKQPATRLKWSDRQVWLFLTLDKTVTSSLSSLHRSRPLSLGKRVSGK